MTNKTTMQKWTVCIALIVLLFAFMTTFAVAGLHMPTQTAHADTEFHVVRCTADNFPDNSNTPTVDQFPGFLTLSDEEAKSLASAVDGNWFLITAINADHIVVYRFNNHAYVSSQSQYNGNSYFRGGLNYNPHYYATGHYHEGVTFTAWESNNSLPTAAGSYYLTQDVTMTGNWNVDGWNVDNFTIDLCLNGHCIVFQGSSYVEIKYGATLNLYDCSNTTRYITTNANGIFTSVSDTPSEGAIPVVGGFIAGSSTSVIQTFTSDNKFNMYGGNICANAIGVGMGGQSTAFTMYGGKICYNNQGVNVGNGTFTMEGGTISNNSSQFSGGGVYVSGTCSFIMNGGTISNNTVTQNGGGVYIYDIYGDGRVYAEINGGTITENAASTFGGGVYIKDATLVLNNGTISNNSAYAGGGVFNTDGSTFTMNGGSILGNESDERGGGLHNASATFTMNGGSFTQNESALGAAISTGGIFTITAGSITENWGLYGAGILCNNGEFHISGAPVIKDNYDENSEPVSNIYLWNEANTVLITIDDALTNETPYGVQMKTPGVFTNDGVAAYKNKFTSDNPAYAVIARESGALALVLEHGHGDIAFTKWTSDDSLPTVAGSYYLTQNVTLSATWVVPAGTTNLCLNGYDIILTNGAFVSMEGRTLNLYDCNESGSADGGHIKGSSTNALQVFGSTFNMYGGTICNNKQGVNVSFGSSFTMYGGKISHNNVNDYGGGVYVHNSTFTMNNGATIEYNSAGYFGGGVYLSDSGTFVMNGGSINNNTAMYGGGVCNDGNFTLTGGLITDNTGTYVGGIYLKYESELYISGAPVIQNNKTEGGNPANIYLFNDSEDDFITIAGELTNTTPYGISMYELGKFTNDNVAAYKNKFTSDNPAYAVDANANGALTLVPHVHSFTYAANGATITATCGNVGCSITEGLALTLVAPTGNMVYDGNARVATIQAGYNAEAFPNATIVYYKGDTIVTSCVAAGTYTAKVTFGEATAQVEFVIENWSIADDDNGVVVEIEGAEVDENIEIEVEVRTSVASEQSEVDYTDVVASKLEQNEEVFIVYDVKLIQITIVSGQEERTEIQPSDIKPGATILVVMDIPQELRGKDIKVLHVHSENDVEFVNDYQISEDGATLTIRTNRLSVFAFIVAKVVPATAPNGLGGGAIAGIVIACLLVVGCILFFLLWFLLKNVWLVVDGKVVRAIRLSSEYGDQSKFLTITCKCVRRDKLEVFESKDAAEEWLKNNQPEAPAEEPKAEEAPIEEPKDSADESND